MVVLEWSLMESEVPDVLEGTSQTSMAEYCTPGILALVMSRQEEKKFKASLGFLRPPLLKTTPK